MQVTNSRQTKRVPGTWRRCTCSNCETTLSTIETIDYPKALVVEQPPKGVEAFVRDRLFLSVYECLKHRKSAQKDATALTDTIISKLLSQAQKPSLRRQQIVSTTTEVLKRFDNAAAVQYAAYHPTRSGDQ